MSAEPTRVLVADCPWLFSDRLPGKGRGASKHYDCLTVEQLCAFPLPPLADDCALFFWRVASMQRAALDVIDVELFARRRRDGWQQYGDQLEAAR
jgi:N6-adenosine-specific RNA methylase IME4